MTALELFNHRVQFEWLPAFCNDPKRQYPLDGFVMKPNELTEKDATDFMRAVDEGVVSMDNGGRFTMPQSKAVEVIFWDGYARSTSSRYISLWVEPVVTIAAMARLHFEYGWPLNCLGMQSRNWSFDLMAYDSPTANRALIAGEVKSKRRELDQFLKCLQHCCELREHECSDASGVAKNAHKKWLGLLRHQPAFFWALGPGCDSRLFRVSYDPESAISLSEADSSCFSFPTITKS